MGSALWVPLPRAPVPLNAEVPHSLAVMKESNSCLLVDEKVQKWDCDQTAYLICWAICSIQGEWIHQGKGSSSPQGCPSPSPLLLELESPVLGSHNSNFIIIPQWCHPVRPLWVLFLATPGKLRHSFTSLCWQFGLMDGLGLKQLSVQASSNGNKEQQERSCIGIAASAPSQWWWF